MADPEALEKRPTPCRGSNGYQIRTSSENMQAYKNFNSENQDKAGKCALIKTVEADKFSVEAKDGHVERRSHGAEDGRGNIGDQSELGSILTRRRLFVDSEGNHWQSPGRPTSENNCSPQATSTPDASEAEKAAGRKRRNSREHQSQQTQQQSQGGKTSQRDSCQDASVAPATVEDCTEANTCPHGVDEQGTSPQMTPPSTPEASRGRKRRSSREQQLQQATQQLQGLNSDQIEAINQILSVVARKPAPDDGTASNSSSADTPSDRSPERAKSEPPICKAQFFETLPSYPELRKKRLSGQRPITPSRVRFADEENEPAGSDDDIPHLPSGNLALRHRRVSRGPDGFAYQVKVHSDEHETSPATVEPISVTGDQDPGLSLKNLGSAAAGAARGALSGAAGGAAVGALGALFTFGLSIPVGAAVGATYKGIKGAKEGLGVQQERNQDTPRGQEQSERATSAPPESRKT